MKFEAKQQHTKREFEIQEQGYTPKVLFAKLLEQASAIYKGYSNPVKSMSVVTVNGVENNAIAQTVAQHQAISQSLSKDN